MIVLKKERQLAQLLAFLIKQRNKHALYSDKWLEYNDKYQTILFNSKK